MTISKGEPSYFHTRHCPTSNFPEICYTETQKHGAMAGMADNGGSGRRE